MRKFCWVYQDIENGKKVLVMRPHRRSVDPKYLVKISWNRKTEIREFSRCQFFEEFKYVGLAKRNPRPGTTLK